MTKVFPQTTVTMSPLQWQMYFRRRCHMLATMTKAFPQTVVRMYLLQWQKYFPRRRLQCLCYNDSISPDDVTCLPIFTMTKAFPQTTVAMSLALHHWDWTIVWENTFVIATRNLNSRLEKYFYATRNLNSPLGKCFCYQIIARKLWQSSGEMLLPVHCNKDIVTISLLQIWKHLPWLSHFQKHSRDDCYNFQTTVTISLLL